MATPRISLLSAITRLTPLHRPAAVATLITEGDVWVNGELVTDCKALVVNGDWVEIMGIGRFGVVSFLDKKPLDKRKPSVNNGYRRRNGAETKRF